MSRTNYKPEEIRALLKDANRLLGDPKNMGACLNTDFARIVLIAEQLQSQLATAQKQIDDLKPEDGLVRALRDIMLQSSDAMARAVAMAALCAYKKAGEA